MKKKAFKAALPHTLPICVGFLFLGMSYGFMMRSKDNNSEYYHHCLRGSGNHGHPFSAIPYFSRRQRAFCVYPSSGKGTSICGDRPSDRFLSEGSAHKRTYELPEAIAILFIVFLHKWKKNTLLSIGGETILYMLLVQRVF